MMGIANIGIYLILLGVRHFRVANPDLPRGRLGETSLSRFCARTFPLLFCRRALQRLFRTCLSASVASDFASEVLCWN
jgi:hypothetical protein